MNSDGATLTDVAAHAGVSKVTASVVLNGSKSGTRVSPATRQRILDSAAALRYHPNAVARGLARGRMNLLSVLFGRVTGSVVFNPYASLVLKGVLDSLSGTPFDVVLSSRPWKAADVSAAPFRDGRTDGVIVVSPFTDSDMVSGLAALDVPLVVVSWTPQGNAVPYVDVDNARGAALAVKHLIELGHTRIAHLGGDENYASAPLRREAYRAALAAHGIETRPRYILPGSYTGSRAAEGMLTLLALPEPPTAVFAANDAIAKLAMEAAKEAGVRVPDQLSIVGFNDTGYGEMIDPPLTTIHEPLQEMGAAAARLLVDMLEGRPSAPGPFLLEPSLVVRGSTAPPSPNLSSSRTVNTGIARSLPEEGTNP